MERSSSCFMVHVRCGIIVLKYSIFSRLLLRASTSELEYLQQEIIVEAGWLWNNDSFVSPPGSVFLQKRWVEIAEVTFWDGLREKCESEMRKLWQLCVTKQKRWHSLPMCWDTSKDCSPRVRVASPLAEVFTLTVFSLDAERVPLLWLMHCHAAMVQDVSRRAPSPVQYSSLIFR